jgi:serine/threonine protein kinase
MTKSNPGRIAEWHNDDAHRDRFAAEGRLQTRLGTHPHVVRAQSVAILESKPYILLDLVTGGDLKKRLARGPSSLAKSSSVNARIRDD